MQCFLIPDISVHHFNTKSRLDKMQPDKTENRHPETVVRVLYTLLHLEHISALKSYF
jgi:hypothetical protein